jgi:glucosyl-3-phosphoglycerate phosphatase
VSDCNDMEAGVPISIYLARHGRTRLNAAGMLRGHLDPPLDAVGLLEASHLARALAAYRPKLIVASPLRRAVETARFVAEKCNLEVEVDDRLIDRDYGRWSGHSLAEVEDEWGSVDSAPGVEPREAVRARTLNALTHIADRVEDAAVVVAHDAVNRLLINGLVPERFTLVEEIPQRTGCFNLLQRARGTWAVVRVDVCPSKYLEPS